MRSLLLAVALAVAVWVRVGGLAATGLWHDEVWSVSLAESGPRAILAATRIDPHPPLHMLVLWLALALPVPLELAARGLSALCGLLTVAVVARAGGSRGLTAAALVASAPLAVIYSREARSYALFALLVTAASSLAVRAYCAGGASWRARTAWTALAIAIGWTHYVGFAAIAVQLVLFAVAHRELDASPDPAHAPPRAGLAAQCAVLAASIVPLLFLIRSASWISLYWIARPDVFDLLRLPAQLVGPAAVTVGGAALQAALGLVVWIALVRTLLAGPAPGSAESRETLAWALLAVLPPLAVFAESLLVKPIWQHKQLLFCLPAFALFAAARFPARALALVIVASLATSATLDETSKDQERLLARTLRARIPPGARVRVWPPYLVTSLGWYLRRDGSAPIDLDESRGPRHDLSAAPPGTPVYWVHYPALPSPSNLYSANLLPSSSTTTTMVGAAELIRTVP